MSVHLSELTLTQKMSQFRRGLSRTEWLRLAGMLVVIVGLNVVGWVIVAALIAPHHYSFGTKTFGLGVGLTAYTLGMRHAFDGDHIAAIDNTTRKLMGDGQRPMTVGFWFSLGHSTVVFALALLLSIGVKTIVGPVQDDNSDLHRYTGLIGASVSGTFLMTIAVVNLIILIGILRVFRDMRRGVFDEATLEDHLNNRGLMNRILRPIMQSITRPGQMYAVGLLFGLGFDTASEVALLVLATAGAAGGLPWYAVLALPVLFAAGMCLFDTIDGTFMNFAYGWAFSKSVRKVFYNIIITTLSIVVAVLIGGLEVLQVLSGQLNLTGGIWDYANNFDLNTAGYIIVSVFVATWIIALTVWRFAHIEEKW
ncbi:MAG: high-affinity nickel-transporter, partial [Pseudonocardiales bacterium]|nr:high-affinity nickel-transporter [Pseudonocardiales bacterium]